ncbi:hypothetical protein FJZ48_01540 [Candidatus Uhrbacteria bacterium]|nr:hypothetical protein [Candidatus Uhrbacteria bacterium]
MEIHGKVVRGKGEAQKLGYPTANLEYQSEQVPEHGIWVCRASLDESQKPDLFGLAVIGMWKLDSGLPSVEVYLLDFDQDIFTHSMNVILDKKIRDLKKFYDMRSLVLQIEKDIEEARKLF